ncbi:MAG: glycosyltransferase family 39 protein [Patescibacteria group bacterium]
MFSGFIKRERAILTVIFLVFIASAAYAFYYRIRPSVDAGVYDQTAVNIAQGYGFRFDRSLPIAEDSIITFQGPIYQYFLAGIYLIFGHHYEAVWLIQALLRAFTALILYLTAVNIFGPEGRRIGWISAAIFGFHPDLIEIGAMLMTETFFIFLSVLAVYVFVILYKNRSYLNSFFLGLFFGLAVLGRSSVGIFLLPFGFYFISRKEYAKFVLFLVTLILVMTPWTIRNYKVYGEFIPTMANFGYNFWVGNHEGGDGEGGNTPELAAAQKEYGYIGANYYAASQFKKFVADHPLQYIKFTISRTVKYFSFMRPMGFWFYQRGLGQFIFVAGSVLGSLILFWTGFAGIFIWFKKEKENRLLGYFFSFVFFSVLSLVLILYETRYRLPVYPFSALFSGLALSRLYFAPKEYFRYFVAAGIAILFLAAASVAMDYEKIFQKFKQIFET